VGALWRFVAEEVTANQIHSWYGDLVFIGVFCIVVIIAGIWWIKRSI
jgi:hypothetical protein